jgi:uncharacterized membrane-anchored protein YjiN (DUF445 family)
MVEPPPLTSAPPPLRDEALRQVQLDAMKRRATAMLAAAAGVFVVARLADAVHPAVGFVRAAAEAALIGGLADWFAVTALFRQPLGLPIPHTAILPNRKERLGRALGNFMQNHFLSREALSSRLRAMRIAERAARWMSQPENSRLIARQVAAGVAKTVEALPDEKTRGLIHDGLVARLRTARVAPLLRNVLALIRSENKHQELLSEAIRLAAGAVDENRGAIRERIKAESPWWVPGIVDERIYRRILLAIEKMLQDIGADPHHPLRAKFDVALERFVHKLEHSPDVIARAEALKEQLLADPVVEEFSTWLWDFTRRSAMEQAARVEGASPGGLERGISAFGTSLRDTPALLAQVDEFVIELTLAAVEQYRGEVAELIAQTVAGWDPDVTARRIELAIGRDLQFIRINGTVVGGLVGLVLHTLSYFWR